MIAALLFALSFMVEPAYAESPPMAVINEVMWMGSDLSTADEWVEILGVGAGSGAAIPIGGWLLTAINGAGEEVTIHRFATGAVIGSGQVLVIGNYGADDSRLLLEPDVVTTAVSLPNAKLLLRLRDASGAAVDEADDGIGDPFAGRNASGSGSRASMERIDPRVSGTLRENWRTAETSRGFDDGAPLFGTPGNPNPSKSTEPIDDTTSSGSTLTGALLPSGVFLTEVLANPAGSDDGEWVEVGNTGTGTVSISGWFIAVGSHAFTIPSARTMSGAFPPRAASGFVLAPDDFAAFRSSVTGLTLSNAGDTVTLSTGAVLIDSWTYPGALEGVSYGRTGTGALRQFCVPTEGAANSCAAPTAHIVLQSSTGVLSGSGVLVGTSSLTVNIAVEALAGSLAGAECRIDYGDGSTSESCNPSTHALGGTGSGRILATLVTACGDTVELSLPYSFTPVTAPTTSSRKNPLSLPVGLCASQDFSGVTISEIFPHPFSDQEAGEWIELRNLSNQVVSLCGWSVDDSEGGSEPYALDGERVPPHGFLVLFRSQTSLILNDEGDRVRLFGPNRFLLAELPFAAAPSGQSFALRDDAKWAWTPFVTPGAENRFRTAERAFPAGRIILSAALPNPAGADTGREWAEVQNISSEPQDLTGWSVQTGNGTPFMLSKIVGQDCPESVGQEYSCPTLSSDLLPSLKVLRFSSSELSAPLTNRLGRVVLLDPDGYISSVLGWEEAEEGVIVRPSHFISPRVPADAVRVVDGDTIDVSFLALKDLSVLPREVERRWLALNDTGQGWIRVRLIGIDAPESHHPFLPLQAYAEEAEEVLRQLIGEGQIFLQFDTLAAEPLDCYNRLLAYAYQADGSSLEVELLRRGLARAYLRFPFALSQEFKAFEAEAKEARLGLWSDDDITRISAEDSQELSDEEFALMHGITLEVSPGSGIVASGSVIRFSPSVSAPLYLSVNSGSYVTFSGSLVITDDVTLRAYAELAIGEAIIHSNIVEASFALARSYSQADVIISEVFPSPPTSSGSLALKDHEWIEIRNPSHRPLALGGWTLDDVLTGGSRPYVIPMNLRIPPRGTTVISSLQSGLKLNNTGDEVHLISPDGEVDVSLEHPSVTTGESYAYVVRNGTSSWCTTELPTPGFRNVCMVAMVPVKSRQLVASRAALPRTTAAPVQTALHRRYKVVTTANASSAHSTSGVLLRLRPLIEASVIADGTLSSFEVMILEEILLALGLTLGIVLMWWGTRDRGGK